jgi:hypothetical protein
MGRILGLARRVTSMAFCAEMRAEETQARSVAHSSDGSSTSPRRTPVVEVVLASDLTTELPPSLTWHKPNPLSAEVCRLNFLNVLLSTRTLEGSLSTSSQRVGVVPQLVQKSSQAASAGKTRSQVARAAGVI